MNITKVQTIRKIVLLLALVAAVFVFAVTDTVYPSGHWAHELIEWAGIEFDPKIVQAFLSLENLEELRSYADIETFENTEAETAPVQESEIVENEA